MRDGVKGGRRSHPRANLRLAVQLHLGDRTLPGQTLNTGSGGLLLDMCGVDGVAEGDTVTVHLGLSDTIKPEEGGYFLAQVVRREANSLAMKAVSPPVEFLEVPSIVGFHPTMADLKRKLLRVANFDVNVLVLGETGVGKNLVAQEIHRHSSRREGHCVLVNCPSIPATLLESQLFGHVKGAFTDASTASPGLFRMADGGTIILDEISAIDPSLQAKLLQAIERREFIPVGGKHPVGTDTRIVAISNEDLSLRIREGAFRADLFYRLNEVSLEIPPLRARKGDIPLLADHFVRRYSDVFGEDYRPLPKRVRGEMLAHAWPGNVRELENFVKRALLLETFSLPLLTAEEAASARTGEADGDLSQLDSENDVKSLTRAAQMAAVVHALEKAGGNKTRAAALLGVSYRTLLRRLKAFGFG